jgi:hypothetical protein
MSQETDKHDETTRGNGYMKLSSMLKDSKKKYKEGMRTELQFENGTDGRRIGINPSATV